MWRNQWLPVVACDNFRGFGLQLMASGCPQSNVDTALCDREVTSVLIPRSS